MLIDRGRRARRARSLILCGLAVVAAGCAGDPEPLPEEPPAPGRWYKVRTHRFDDSLTAEQREAIEKLESIGYVSGSAVAPALRGVTLHDRRRAAPGFNLYTSGHAPEALLTDMDGTVLHRWRHGFWEAFPDYPVERDHKMTAYWRRAHLFDNGDLLAIFEGLGLIKLDRDSNLLWTSPVKAHHDLEVLDNGDIVVLTREARLVPWVNPDEPILEDFVSVLDAGGRELRRVSVLEAVERSRFSELWDREQRHAGDIFHTNTLDVLDGRAARRLPLLAAGRVLVSMLYLHAIAVIDLERAEVVWALRSDFDSQHDPQELDNGNLLLFDNRGLGERSRVLEIDPLTGEAVWVYAGPDDRPLYSKWCGTAQRLPNGNTLITESDNGRALEITPAGETVWEFYNPHRAGDDDAFIATLFELLRLPPGFAVDWAGGGAPTAAP